MLSLVRCLAEHFIYRAYYLRCVEEVDAWTIPIVLEPLHEEFTSTVGL